MTSVELQMPTSNIREILVLTYVLKWIEKELEQYEKLEHSSHLIAFADNLHQKVLGHIVNLKRELRDQMDVQVIECKVCDNDILVKYKHKGYIQESGFHKDTLLIDARRKIKELMYMGHSTMVDK